MSGSSIIVAVNALLLKRTELEGIRVMGAAWSAEVLKPPVQMHRT
jgi:hypothetical protein